MPQMLFFLPCDERWSGVHIMSTCSFDHLNAVSAHSCRRSGVFSHHFQDTDVWGFRERKTNWDHMLLAVGNIKYHVMRFSVTNQVAWLDLSFDAWLGSFYASKHTVQACIIKKEHQSDPRPLKFCLWGKGHVRPHMLGIKTKWTCNTGVM